PPAPLSHMTLMASPLPASKSADTTLREYQAPIEWPTTCASLEPSDTKSVVPRSLISLELLLRLKLMSHEKFCVCTGDAVTMNSIPERSMRPALKNWVPP